MSNSYGNSRRRRDHLVTSVLVLGLSGLLTVGPAGAVEDPPTIASVTPDYGTALGGDLITIRGTGLASVSAVKFMATDDYDAVTDLEIVSNTELRLVTPRLAEGSMGIALYVGEVPTYTSATFVAQSVTAVTPARAVDLSGVQPQVPQCFDIAGRFGVHPDAGAVILNVTTVAPAGPGHVVVYPDTHKNGQTPAPLASTVNFIPGQDVANATLVQTEGGGGVCFLTRGAVAGLKIDVTGFTHSAYDPFYLANRPERYLDTRPATRIGDILGPIEPRLSYEFYPGHAVGGVALVNVTTSGVQSPGNLRLFAAGSAVPATSTTNYLPGFDRATLALVRVDQASSKVGLYSDSGGKAHVIVDMLGASYLWPPSLSAQGSSLQLVESRVMDTRVSTQTGPVVGALKANTVYRLPVDALPQRHPDVHTAILNVISVAPSSVGHLRVYPEPAGAPIAPPNASVLNYVVGRDTSNLVFVDIPKEGFISFYSGQPAGQSSHLVVDVVGYVGAVYYGVG